MSAFIVENRTVAGIIRGMLAIGVEIFDGASDPVAIGNRLFAMNTDAVNQRYGECNPAPVYVDQYMGDISLVACYRAMRCMLYQCAEGTVYDSAPYRELQAIADKLKATWNCDITKTREYDEARWR